MGHSGGRLLRTGPFAGPEVDFFDGLGASAEVAWLKNKRTSAVSAVPTQTGAASTEALENCVPANLPVHRPEVITQLGEELATLADALRYRDNFARLLPKRIRDLEADLRSKSSKNLEDAEGTLLSLNVGATMVGAPRLQYVADRCLSDFRGGREMSCLPALAGEAERFLMLLSGAEDAPPAPGATPPGSFGSPRPEQS